MPNMEKVRLERKNAVVGIKTKLSKKVSCFNMLKIHIDMPVFWI